MSFKDLTIKHSYTGKGSYILNDFIIPVLSESIQYDRITSFFSVDSLLSISNGMQELYEHNGKMRLIIGVHSVPREIIEASLKKEHMQKEINIIREDLYKNIATISDLLLQKKLSTIAWMIDDGLLQVKVASTIDGGMFHPKTFIFTDDKGDKVVAIGSPNETASGLGFNFEQVMVSKSWETIDAIEDQEAFFECLWDNKSEESFTFDITEETVNIIKEALGDSFINPMKGDYCDIKDLLDSLAEIPSNFFVSGDIPALYMHQERAVLDALSRWPVRVLFADEVGLGKTFEAGATIAFLRKYCGIKRVVILTPKSVLQQWQDELYENFGIDAWMYDSGKGVFKKKNGESLIVDDKNPLKNPVADVMLISAQYARGGRNRSSIFDLNNISLPDLLVVDEAHSARVSKDISGNSKKTRMYTMLESVSNKIPHLILATATPMQKDAEEYFSMIQLLGMPKVWRKARTYRKSLELISRDTAPDISDSFNAAKMLLSTISVMQPRFNMLTEEEKSTILRIMAIKEGDSVELGLYVQNNWELFKSAFIKLHPANLLTIRNTRRALSEAGYRFPKRELKEVKVNNNDDIKLFYIKVNEYISDYFFSVERALEPDCVFNVGFIRVNYMQRVASSLYSCKCSLKRRLEKILELQYELQKKGILEIKNDNYYSHNSFDDIDEDELLIDDNDSFDEINRVYTQNERKQIQRAINLEITSLNPLIDQVSEILKNDLDLKIESSIKKALQCIEEGDKVLLFSRYTDTVDALVEKYRELQKDKNIVYGVYTGQKSVLINRESEIVCSKDDIKRELNSGSLRIIFCSDAASEGLNLQAARVLINVDVPWTPSRLEQRIGRVARLGQTAESVDIYNVWYPDSIEARMYHRIQKRLNETDLAVGEFPDVVANEIKNSILYDTDEDDSLEHLREIRNSYLTKALEALWKEPTEGITISNSIRTKLLKLCKSKFLEDGFDKRYGANRIIAPDGNVYFYTEKEGSSESISLKSKIWNYITFEDKTFLLMKGDKKIPKAIVSKNNKDKWIDADNLLSLLLKESYFLNDIKKRRPSMLVDNQALNLRFALEGDVSDPPNFW